MKKIILIAFAILVSTTTFAQGIDVGIKAGANFASLTDVSDVSTRTGLVIGAFVSLKFTEKMAIQGDLLFSQQGAKGDNGFNDIELDYINFPIVFKYYIVNRVNIQAGPQFGSVVNDNFSYGDYQSFDVSGVVGIGLDLPLHIRVTARYNFGLSDIAFVGFYGNGISTSSKNSVFSLTAGFTFL